MALTVHTISSFVHGSNVINQILSAGFSPNLVQLLEGGSGLVDAGYSGVVGSAPELAFSTSAIKTALADLGGIDGIAIAASNGIFYFQKTTSGGLRAGATSHVKATIVQGIMVPQSLTIPHQGKATLSYRVVMTSADGAAAPVAFLDSQSLDAGIVTAAELYVLGSVEVNGVTLEGVSQVVINFGVGVWIDGGSGLVYPTHCGVSQRRPTIAIQTRDIATSVGWGLLGQAQNNTDSVVTLTGLTNGGSLNGSDQITATIDAGRMHYTDLSGVDGERMAGQITITPTSDGTNAIIALGGLT